MVTAAQDDGTINRHRRPRSLVLSSGLLTVCVLGSAVAPAAAGPSPDGIPDQRRTGATLDAGWQTSRGGQELVLRLDDHSVRSGVQVTWVAAEVARFREGCELVVDALQDQEWVQVAAQPVSPAADQTQQVPFPHIDTAGLRLRLRTCGGNKTDQALGQVTVQTPLARLTPLDANFDREPEGTGAYAWDSRVGQGNVAVGTPSAAAANGESRALHITNADSAASSLTWSFFPRAEQTQADYRFRVDQSNARSEVGLRRGTNRAAAVVGFFDGRIYAYDGASEVDLAPHDLNRYYHVSITASPSLGRYDVSVDGRVLATGLHTRTSDQELDNLVAVGFAGAESTWLDDVLVRPADTTPSTRVFTGPFTGRPLPRIGQLTPPTAGAPRPSTWSIGAETLDRDFADFSAYADELAALGIGEARLQGGWARTEQIPGTYDWAWLDEAVNGLSERGIKPWLEFSYGNPAIPNGGTPGLNGQLPSGDGLLAWDRWVTAMVERYGDRVQTWSVWNEPDRQDATQYGHFAARTSRLVKTLQPEAKIIVLNTAGLSPTYFRSALTAIQQDGALDLIDTVGYHTYTENPDAQYTRVAGIRAVVDEFDPDLKLMQTENGAPSRYTDSFALRNYRWTETSQAKWNSRRMLGDHGRGIATNLFTISDLRYSSPGTVTWNPKGLLEVNGAQQVTRRKLAFHAAQATSTLFNSDLVPYADSPVQPASEPSLSVFGYRSVSGRGFAASYWIDSGIPGNWAEKQEVTVAFPHGAGTDLVLVDVATGEVFDIPGQRIKRTAASVSVQVPAYDAPLVVAERDVVTPLLSRGR